MKEVFKIFVEGVADKRFIEQLLLHIWGVTVDENCVISTGGYTNLLGKKTMSAYVNQMKMTTDDGGVNLVIFDADEDCGQARFRPRLQEPLCPDCGNGMHGRPGEHETVYRTPRGWFPVRRERWQDGGTRPVAGAVVSFHAYGRRCGHVWAYQDEDKGLPRQHHIQDILVRSVRYMLQYRIDRICRCGPSGG